MTWIKSSTDNMNMDEVENELQEIKKPEKQLLEISFAEPNEAGEFPKLPRDFNPTNMRTHLEQLANVYLTTPGLIDEPLTQEDKKRLTASEIMLYEDIREALEAGCPQAKRQFWLERMLPQQPKRIESVSLSGNMKNWREFLQENMQSLNIAIHEAEVIEAERRKNIEQTYSEG